jgi:antitoxin ParD1/3/4
MQLSLGPDTTKLIEARLQRGHYRTAEEVILAALASLERDESYGDFAPGEMDALLAEAEAGGESLDGEQVFAELRRLRERYTGNGG